MDGSDLFVSSAAHVLSRGLPPELLIHAFNWSVPFTSPYSKNNNIVANNDAKISFTVPNDVTAQTDLTAAVEPQLNQSKGELRQVVTFNFKHLLSRIEFTLQAAADQVSAGGTINNGTTITLNEIRIGDAGGSGFYNSGVYSTLDNTWSEVGGNQSFVLNSNNFVSGTNVLNNSKNSQQTLIGSDSNDYIMVIPQTIRQLPIYVNYTVKTEGQNDEGEWDNSIVTNERTTYVKEMIFSPNHIYKFHIVLGMSTVEVSATVGDWKGGHNEIVNLPKNN